ncbi:hypothetical protein KXD96_06675 [Mycobacterium sp. SMC-2]|uniref:hypothetical protein n=1 Tax=Mycobacterium sp. SMC-2 TaxID=2857058 RepID=UPI0021B42DC5|nr:hypothetical protein [Mycobacterium sp. SMC-2]UXA07795.1 hypothetical protein KXD96_06675 [Mycobacterium sp. SMC-2]
MTGPHSETESPGTRPISVAELLARNGTIGAPAVTRRRRRRRGDSDAVTVAELTGEIPVIREDQEDPRTAERPSAEPVAEETAPEEQAEDKPATAYWSQPEPRWPKSPSPPKKASGPERSEYPRPLSHLEAGETQAARQSSAEGMNPDPLDHYGDLPVDVMDSEVREAEPALEDSAYVRSYLQTDTDEADDDAGAFAVGLLADGQREEDHPDGETGRAGVATDVHAAPGRLEALWRGGLVVFQSILAVAFGAGLFVAFDQLWRWNSIVALVLSVLVILGLVAGVRVVRKTEDIASTLIAVAVGALITLGPLALSLQSG